MSRSHRVTKLEHALSPRDSVLLWLEEVRRYPSLDDYARATLDRPDAEMPLDRILERVATATSPWTKGTDPARAQEAIRQESRDAVFLYALVVELNQAAWDLSRDWAPIALALTAQLRCLAADQLSFDATVRAADAAAAEAVDRGWQAWWANATAMVSEVEVATAAHTEVEARYFNGRSALFVQGADDLASTQVLADRVRQLMDALPTPLNARVPEQDEDRTRELTQRVAERVDALTEAARITAFQLLGEPQRAARLAERWLRRRSESTSDSTRAWGPPGP